MFFGKLTKEQKENYFREFFWKEDYANYDITGIDCDRNENVYGDNASYTLSCVLEKRVCDEDAPIFDCETVRDYQPDINHSLFMIKNLGASYLMALKTYAKSYEAKPQFRKFDFEKCDNYLAKCMEEDKSVVSLEKYMSDKSKDTGLKSSNNDFEMVR